MHYTNFIMMPGEEISTMPKLYTVKSREHAQALMERDRILLEHPELKSFQRRIDDVLDNAGSDHNRLVLIHTLLTDHLRKLAEQLRVLIASQRQ